MKSYHKSPAAIIMLRKSVKEKGFCSCSAWLKLWFMRSNRTTRNSEPFISVLKRGRKRGCRLAEYKKHIQKSFHVHHLEDTGI